MLHRTEITATDLRVGDRVRAKSHGRDGTLDIAGTVHSIVWDVSQTRATATVALDCPARLTGLSGEGVSSIKRFSIRRSGRWALVGAEDLPIRSLHYPLPSQR